MASVEILLATFNGEAHLAEQLDSLLRQDYHDWRVLIRDDGSTDGTVTLLQRYVANYPKRFFWAENSSKRLGLVGNFSALMQCATAPYVMFCDQDDIWWPDKISVSLAHLQMLENHQPEGPALVYTDLAVCDDNAVRRADSYWVFQHIDPELALHPAGALIQDNATGNTFIFNQALNRLAAPVPAQAPGHDWWVALVALYAGRIDYLNRSTLDYRQHARNASGQKGLALAELFKKLPGYCVTMRVGYLQAGWLVQRLHRHLSPANARLLQSHAALPSASLLTRLRALFRWGYWRVSDRRARFKLLYLLFCRKCHHAG